MVVAVVERHNKLRHRRMWTLQPNGESGPRHAEPFATSLKVGAPGLGERSLASTP